MNPRKLVGWALIAASLLAACGGALETTDETEAESQPVATAIRPESDGDSPATTQGHSGTTLQAGGDLPDDFPLPFPPEARVVSHVRDGLVWNLNLYYEGDRVEELTAFYQQWIGQHASEVLLEAVSSSSTRWVIKYGDRQAAIAIGAADDSSGEPRTFLQLSP